MSNKKETLPNKKKTQGELVVFNTEGKPVKFSGDPIETLRNPAVALTELITGGIASVSDFHVIAGRLVQATLKGKLLMQLGRELYQMREKGKIKEDYFVSNDASASLNDLLEFIDTEAPDNEKFKAMKAVFLTEIALDTSETDRFIAHQLLKICIQLNSMDILILKTCYDITHKEKDDEFYSRVRAYSDWVNMIRSKIGIEFEELVGLSDDRLVNLGLITPRKHGDKSGVNVRPYFRLTKLGVALCNFLQRYP